MDSTGFGRRLGVRALSRWARQLAALVSTGGLIFLLGYGLDRWDAAREPSTEERLEDAAWCTHQQLLEQSAQLAAGVYSWTDATGHMSLTLRDDGTYEYSVGECSGDSTSTNGEWSQSNASVYFSHGLGFAADGCHDIVFSIDGAPAIHNERDPGLCFPLVLESAERSATAR